MDFFEEWNERLFGDIGAKFKKIALVFFWIEIFASGFAAVIFFFLALTSRYDNGLYLSIMLACVVGGPLSAWLSSVGLYAIGEHLELLESINANAGKMRKHFCGDPQPSYATSDHSTTHSGWTCGQCGKKHAAHVRYCTCGMPRPTETPAVKRKREGDWICKKCGTANTNATTYCKDCGEYK